MAWAALERFSIATVLRNNDRLLICMKIGGVVNIAKPTLKRGEDVRLKRGSNRSLHVKVPLMGLLYLI